MTIGTAFLTVTSTPTSEGITGYCGGNKTLPRYLTEAGTAQWHTARLQAGWSGVRVPAGAGNFSLHHRVQTGSGAHPASYTRVTRGSFPGGKAAGGEADHSPPSSAEVNECVELYVHSPIRLHGVVLSWKESKGTNLRLILCRHLTE
jgi:hypothetical protein